MEIIMNYVLPFAAICAVFFLFRTSSFIEIRKKYSEVFTLLGGLCLGVLGLEAIQSGSKRKIIFIAILGLCLLYVTLKKSGSKEK